MEKRFKFTQRKLEDTACPGNVGRVLLVDDSRPELQLQVTKHGTKSYYCRYWDRSKGYVVRQFIGRFDRISLTEARSRARSLLADADRATHEKIPIKPRKKEPTFAIAFESYLSDPYKRRKKGPRREATTHTYLKAYRCHLEREFGERKLSKISHQEVDAFHTRVGNNNGRYAANRLVTLISGIYNDAICRGWQGANPANGIEKYQERPRERFLEEHEIGPFIRACLQERVEGGEAASDVVLLTLFAGLRKRNACGAAWEDVDIENRVWTIPGDVMKNRDPHRVYLSTPSLEILARRYANRKSKVWVFPGVGNSEHLVEPYRGLKRIVERAAIDPTGVGMHCLKHTFLTYAGDAGLPYPLRQRLAAHRARASVLDGYTHALETRAREAYEKVAQHMLRFSGMNGGFLDSRS